jgi:TRAP-type transport system periplasmic protein
MKITRIAGLVAAAVVAATPLAAKELKLAHFMSPQHPMDQRVMTPFAARIGEASGGELTVKVFPAGELGSGPNQQYRRAVTGIADIAFNLPQYTPAQFKRSVLLHTPGLFSDPEQATRRSGARSTRLPQTSPRSSSWPSGQTIPRSCSRARRRCGRWRTLRGMKVRVPDPVSATIVEAWGGIPVSLPATETYNAMSTGVVDAVMIDASAVGSYNLQEVTKYVTLNTPGALSTFSLIMNRGAWEALTDDQRALIRAESGEALSLAAAQAFKAAGDRGIATLKEANVELIELTPEALAELEAAAAGPVEAFLREEGEKAGFDGAAFVAGFRATQ